MKCGFPLLALRLILVYPVDFTKLWLIQPGLEKDNCSQRVFLFLIEILTLILDVALPSAKVRMCIWGTQCNLFITHGLHSWRGYIAICLVNCINKATVKRGCCKIFFFGAAVADVWRRCERWQFADSSYLTFSHRRFMLHGGCSSKK